jgi:hypothetical protein
MQQGKEPEAGAAQQSHHWSGASREIQVQYFLGET